MSTSRSFAVHRAALFCVALLFAQPAPCAAPAPDLLFHKPAPQFVRNDIDGQPVDLASLRGRVVLLTFWATWCAPCQIEMPHFIRWQNELGPQGLQIIAISMDDDAAPAIALARKRKLNYPVIMGDEQLGSLYGGILGLPVTFLIDRRGTIVARFKGESNLKAMKAKLLKLLAVE